MRNEYIRGNKSNIEKNIFKEESNKIIRRFLKVCNNIPIKNAVYKDNWDLSVARATSIVRILTEEYKINPTRLTASGKGEYSPRATNANPEGRASNR